MAAPIAIADTHVHSMRTASDAEVLVARVRTKDGTAGYGFTFNDDAGVARDMAGWDALGRSKGVALHALLGGTHRREVKCADDVNPALPADWPALRQGILENKFDLLRLDPFAWGSVEQFSTIAAAAAAFDLGIALLAPNGHPWEIQFCVSLIATIRGDDARVIVRKATESKIQVKDEPGIGVDWASEPAFSKLQWQS